MIQGPPFEGRALRWPEHAHVIRDDYTYPLGVVLNIHRLAAVNILVAFKSFENSHLSIRQTRSLSSAWLIAGEDPMKTLAPFCLS